MCYMALVELFEVFLIIGIRQNMGAPSKNWQNLFPSPLLGRITISGHPIKSLQPIMFSEWSLSVIKYENKYFFYIYHQNLRKTEKGQTQHKSVTDEL